MEDERLGWSPRCLGGRGLVVKVWWSSRMDGTSGGPTPSAVPMVERGTPEMGATGPGRPASGWMPPEVVGGASVGPGVGVGVWGESSGRVVEVTRPPEGQARIGGGRSGEQVVR